MAGYSYSFNSPQYRYRPNYSEKLLGDNYIDDGSYVLNFTADEKWLNCAGACDDCKICRSVNPFYQQCWRSCDKCRYCHLKEAKSVNRDPPYFNRHPDTPDPRFVDFSLAKFTTTGVCGPVLYNDWVKQYNNYMQCLRCQEQDLCWSPYQQRCIECDEGNLNRTCESKFGCPNTKNPMFPPVPPINPLYTDCVRCWGRGY